MIDGDCHLVVVAPHPDDETLALGGTIHDHVRRGGTCEIVAVTDGEAADDRAGADERSALVETRIAERAAALEALGASGAEVTRLGYPDREVSEHVVALERDLTALAAARQDCLVVVPWRDDPHPDHWACAQAGIQAAAVAGASYVEVPIWAWYDAAARRRLPQARVRRSPISAEARRRKRTALRCFRSQLELLPRGRGPILPQGFLKTFDHPFEVLIA